MDDIFTNLIDSPLVRESPSVLVEVNVSSSAECHSLGSVLLCFTLAPVLDQCVAKRTWLQVPVAIKSNFKMT